MRIAVLTGAIVLIGAANGAQAAEKGQPLDDAQCKAAWTIVSPNGAAISKDKRCPPSSIGPWSIRTRTQSSMPTSSKQAARPVG